MKTYLNRLGFTIIELVIVLLIVTIALGIGVYAFQNRSSHFQLRGATRELLSLMKLAQSSAIRANMVHRIAFLNPNGQYKFQVFSPTTGWNDVPASEGSLGRTYDNTAKELVFQNMSVCGSGIPDCFSPLFNADGTLNPSGTLEMTDGEEIQTLNWTIGGAIRVQ